MPAEEVAEVVLEVIEGGKSVSNVIQFVADNGDNIAQGVQSTAQAGNGIAATITSLVSGGVTAGLGMLAVDVGVAGMAIAPALGILAGVGLYELAPEFWENVSNSLLEAGQTIGGKVYALLTEDGRVAYSQETIEIFKNAFIEAKLYDGSVEITSDLLNELTSTKVYDVSSVLIDHFLLSSADINYGLSVLNKWATSDFFLTEDLELLIAYILSRNSITNQNLAYLQIQSNVVYIYYFMNVEFLQISQSTSGDTLSFNEGSHAITEYYRSYNVAYNTSSLPSGYVRISNRMIVREGSVTTRTRTGDLGFTIDNNNPSYYTIWPSYVVNTRGSLINYTSPANAYIPNIAKAIPSASIQPNATYPKSSETIPTTYPDWIPITTPQEFPTFYPVEMPYELPEQEQAQNPVPLTDPAEWVKWIIENLPIPDPDPDPYPEPGPEPSPDPDPQPDPEPAPEPDPEPAEPNPPDPNTPIQPDPDPIVPPILTPVSVNALFTVYNPSSSQLNSLGAFLWSSSILDQLVKIWQNPMDGIISLRQVYCTPAIGSSTNIILGTLDSSVPAPIVTSQFATVDCGTITIDEKNHNVTDYSPYATVHLYLPFVGIVELDTDEVMNATIGVKYTVDVYTGTCLAEVSVTRSPDMTVTKILYTFSGNCSQEIPITSSSHAGWMQALLGLAAGAATIASGGSLVAAGAAAAGEGMITSGALRMGGSLAHEMVHIAHSGSLSSNAGIMGQRKPYIITGRRKGYDANGYNEIYGYPANKSVFLVNCTGFVQVKAIDLQSAATEQEKQEILQWLKSGVYL